MAVTYQQLLHDVAIRLNALVGGQVASITTTYDTAVLATGNFKSADWPFGSIRDAILMAEEDFAWAIADTANHPWRSSLGAVTGVLGDGSPLPMFASTGPRIIGVFGAVLDATDNAECLEGELDQIMRVNRLKTAGLLTLEHYLYRIDGRRIRHTRDGVIIDVCVYDRNQGLGEFAINGNALLPDVLEGPIVARALSLLTKDGAFADQAAIYTKYADQALARIREGLTSVGPKAVPVSAGEDA